jgi:hypothetical protein
MIEMRGKASNERACKDWIQGSEIEAADKRRSVGTYGSNEIILKLASDRENVTVIFRRTGPGDSFVADINRPGTNVKYCIAAGSFAASGNNLPNAVRNFIARNDIENPNKLSW